MSKKGDKHYTKQECQFIVNNFNSMSFKELAEKLNRKASSIASKCRRLGLITVDGNGSSKRVGKLNGNWKGGLSYLESGYVRDNVKGKNVHTVVMEEELGRKLINKEMIHHIDGIKHNNHLSNLVLCSNASEHRHLHCSLERAAFALVRQGLIKFDRDSGNYYL